VAFADGRGLVDQVGGVWTALASHYPATLIDPDGHITMNYTTIDEGYTWGTTGSRPRVVDVPNTVWMSSPPPRVSNTSPTTTDHSGTPIIAFDTSHNWRTPGGTGLSSGGTASYGAVEWGVRYFAGT